MTNSTSTVRRVAGDQMPPYLRVAAEIRRAIKNRRYQVGDHLPSTERLMQDHKVAATTAQKAMTTLVHEGLVEGRQGSGWYVAPPKIKYDMVTQGSTASRLAAQRQVGPFAQQVLAQGLVPRQAVEVYTTEACETIAELLRVPDGTPLVVRSRVMFASDQPVQLCTSYYPESIAGGTRLAGTEFLHEGGPQVLADLGHVPTRYEDTIDCRLPTDEESATLGTSAYVPVFYLVRTEFDQTDLPIEVGIIVMPGDRHRLHYAVSAD